MKCELKYMKHDFIKTMKRVLTIQGFCLFVIAVYIVYFCIHYNVLEYAGIISTIVYLLLSIPQAINYCKSKKVQT